MTEIEKKALALVNEVAGHDFVHPRDMGDKSWLLEALCRAIEQHEAFRQEVSDAVCEWFDGLVPGHFQPFIIAKPDPLVEAMTEAFSGSGAWEPCDTADANALRAAIEKRGGKIVWGEG